MTWFRTDDKLAFHWKTLRAGNAAMGAWVRLGSYSANLESDGFLQPETVAAIASADEIAKLVSVGLLIAHSDGRYELHDYLKYNPSKAELETDRNRWAAKRRAKAYRGASPGDAQGDAPGASGSGRVGLGSDQRSRAETNLPDQPVRSEDPLSPAERERVKRLSDRPPAPADLTLVSAAPPRDDVLTVLEHWAAKLYPGRTVKFDDKRRKRVKQRLADGFTVDQLKLVVDGALRDDWLMGRRDGSPKDGYRDVHTVFRDVAQVERLLAMTKQGLATLASRPRNDDRPSDDPQVATGIRSLVSEAPSETPLSLEEQRKRATSLSEMFKAIGSGGAK